MMNIGTLRLIAVVALAGCSSHPSTGGVAGALVASESAQASSGVFYYEVSGSTVSLLSRNGAVVGLLRLSAPTAETRQVDINFGDGAAYSNEISRPTAGRFIAPVLENREGFIQGDPALAPFFATQSVELKVQALTKALQPSALATCEDITWATGCLLCPSDSAYPCVVSTISGGTVADGYAYCPPVNYCDPYDVVHKTRTCFDAGGCSQQAFGFVACGGGTHMCGNPPGSGGD